jgi:hypothetical protein
MDCKDIIFLPLHSVPLCGHEDPNKRSLCGFEEGINEIYKHGKKFIYTYYSFGCDKCVEDQCKQAHEDIDDFMNNRG